MASSARSNALPREIPPRERLEEIAPPAEASAQPMATGYLFRLARVLGYGLLLISFIDFLYVLIPAKFMDPVWEYQFVGNLIKLVPIPLLALALVFAGDGVERQEIEWPLLKFFSWLTLILSIILFFLIPLTVANTLRIHQFNNEQISTQVNQQRQQIESNQVELQQATPQQLLNLLSSPNAALSPEDARAQILNNLNQAKEQADTRAEQARANVKQNLIKNSLKLVSESFLGSFLFLYAWLISGWARRGKGTLTTADQPQHNPATAFGRRVSRMLGRRPKRMQHRIR
ncbi:HpsJ family protein [Nodosilinea sp. E11]|uniref:HpsJ-like protein, cyanoexosortase A-associated n=1 Tax=Nodosilinea sp. E11 TaxID=3037479 RepID=UPI0029352F79|nr:HpsJ family protein [Nodosilinea sp. E11]WOD41533.1 HpsJ family protein [Nodosilinea sp. E11]